MVGRWEGEMETGKGEGISRLPGEGKEEILGERKMNCPPEVLVGPPLVKIYYPAT